MPLQVSDNDEEGGGGKGWSVYRGVSIIIHKIVIYTHLNIYKYIVHNRGEFPGGWRWDGSHCRWWRLSTGTLWRAGGLLGRGSRYGRKHDFSLPSHLRRIKLIHTHTHNTHILTLSQRLQDLSLTLQNLQGQRRQLNSLIPSSASAASAASGGGSRGGGGGGLGASVSSSLMGAVGGRKRLVTM